jgi:hypothetical protein
VKEALVLAALAGLILPVILAVRRMRRLPPPGRDDEGA